VIRATTACPVGLDTPRLRLRRWRDSDRDPFAALNADPAVMEHFPSALDRAASDALAARADRRFAEQGFGLWALEVRATGRFIGFTGLTSPDWDAPFTPAVEVGWRLARDAWGHGYATEAARASLADGFARLPVDEIVSFTVPANRRSRRVMEALGMGHRPEDDFDHPALPVGHPLRRHVLYRLPRPAAEIHPVRSVRSARMPG
jgi:RimJ/RimL family protein N-acetyltransferase